MKPKEYAAQRERIPSSMAANRMVLASFDGAINLDVPTIRDLAVFRSDFSDVQARPQRASSELRIAGCRSTLKIVRKPPGLTAGIDAANGLPLGSLFSVFIFREAALEEPWLHRLLLPLVDERLTLGTSRTLKLECLRQALELYTAVFSNLDVQRLEFGSMYRELCLTRRCNCRGSHARTNRPLYGKNLGCDQRGSAAPVPRN